MNILVLNAGSSSLKFRLYTMASGRDGQSEQLVCGGQIDRIGQTGTVLRWSGPGDRTQEHDIRATSPAEAAEQAIQAVLTQDHGAPQPPQVDAIGHRIVHGGLQFVGPTRIDAKLEAALKDLSELAPLHNPAGLSGIASARRRLPNVRQVAVFDTAFHRDLPPEAALYALPHALQRPELRRYGFHGISYQYVTNRLLEHLGRPASGTRLILCHLGNGASVCAVLDGRSIDTSMGFTPLEGLIMGTRAGDLDPGLVLYLVRSGAATAERLEDLLNHSSGLLALSNLSADVRDLEEAAAHGNPSAELALRCFAYRVRKYIGAYAAALGGLDALAFSGGIGEHSATMRARIVAGLDLFHICLEPDKNAAVDGQTAMRISADAQAPSVWVIPTNEELQIARDTFHLLTDSPVANR
jgi:acetate kinase